MVAMPALNAESAHFAGIGGLPNYAESFTENALRTGSTIASVGGGISSFAGWISAPVTMAAFGAGFVMDWLANNVRAADKKAALTDWYRDQVASQLGIDPSRVALSDLELAATVNPAVAKALAGVDQERRNANTVSMLSNAGASVAGAMLPAGGAIAHAGVKIAAEMAAPLAGGIAGGMAADWMTKPEALKNPQIIAEHLAQMQQQGQTVAPIQTFLLRVAKSEALQHAVKEATGRDYHALSMEEQALLMNRFPRIAEYATRDAEYLNRGGKPQELVFASDAAPASGTGWAARMDARRAAPAPVTQL